MLSIHTAATVDQLTVLRGSTKAFKLAVTFAPVPGRLVIKIQGLQFIDEGLLPDNFALLRHMEALNSLTTHLPLVIGTRPRLCLVNSLLSPAVLSESQPHLVKSLLAYLTLIMSEARCNRGDDWLS